MKKRGNNEGTITKRKDGRYVARVSLGNGKRKCFYGKTRQEASEKMKTALSNLSKGLTLHDDRMTVKQYLEKWLEDIVKPRVRLATYRSYEQIARNHIIPSLGKIPLSKLTPQQVQAFLLKKHQEGLSVAHFHRVLRAALMQAMKWDMVSRNVASLVSVPKKPSAQIVFLSPEQAKTFLQAVKGTKHEALFTVAIAIGLRLGEILGLKWEDIDFEKETLSVRRQFRRVLGTAAFCEPKTQRAKRTIPLPKFALEALKEHRLIQEFQIKPLAGNQWKEHGLVFTSGIGTPLEERNMRRSLEELLSKHNLPKLRFHDLRHSCASLLLALGLNPRIIMEILGHSQITLTLNTYAHVAQELQTEAAEKMNALFSTNTG